MSSTPAAAAESSSATMKSAISSAWSMKSSEVNIRDHCACACRARAKPGRSPKRDAPRKSKPYSRARFQIRSEPIHLIACRLAWAELNPRWPDDPPWVVSGTRANDPGFAAGVLREKCHFGPLVVGGRRRSMATAAIESLKAGPLPGLQAGPTRRLMNPSQWGRALSALAALKRREWQQR